VPDSLWTRIEAILDSEDGEKAKASRGRPRVDRRVILDGIIFRLRTGCRWNDIPPVYGSDSTLHRYFRRWSRSGVFERVWAALVEHAPELFGLWTPPVEARPEGGESGGAAPNPGA
jgi:transposase